jgi:hypothetical protein
MIENILFLLVGVVIGVIAAAVYLHSHTAKAVAAVTAAATKIDTTVAAVKPKV